MRLPEGCPEGRLPVHINLFFCLDEGYIPQLRVLLFSLCESNPQCRFTAYITHTKLEPKHFDVLRSAVPPGRCELVDIPYPRDRFPVVRLNKRWTEETFYRLFAAQLLPQTLERVLYLDPDIIILKDICSFYQTELGDAFFAGASHMFFPMQVVSRLRLSLPKSAQYLNAGVLLLNLHQLREEQNIEQMYAFIHANRYRLPLYDQDILNCLYHKRTIYIDALHYNLDERYYWLHFWDPFTIGHKVSIPWVKQHCAIMHFSGKNKPWKKHYRGLFKKHFYDPVAARLQAWDAAQSNG